MTAKLSSRPAFSAGASLRIVGSGLDFDDITREIGYVPSHVHTEGRANLLNEPYATDQWSLNSPLGKSAPLDAHLKWLAEVILPKSQYILRLRNKYRVDIYCFKTLYTEQASLNLSTDVIRFLAELDFELGVSLICLPEAPEPAQP